MDKQVLTSAHIAESSSRYAAGVLKDGNFRFILLTKCFNKYSGRENKK